MKFQKTLHGKVTGSMPVEELFKHLQHLSREAVNVNASGCTAAVFIVEQWNFDGQYFDVQLSQLAVDFLQTVDDPRSELVAVLFNEIGVAS